MEVVGEADSFDEVLGQLETIRPEVVVMDIFIPGPGFQESFRILRERGLGVVAFGEQPESRFGARSLESGASAYLSKTRTSEELVWAIQRAYEGRTYTTPDTARQILRSEGNGDTRVPHELLSPREFQVLLLLGAGRAVGRISEELSLSPKTISTYRSRVLEKLGLRSTADIVRYVLENDLL